MSTTIEALNSEIDNESVTEERDVMVVGDVKDHMAIPGQRFTSSEH